MDEPAGAQLHPTEVADHQDEDVRQLVGVDLSEDGFASCSAGFTIVVGPENKSFVAEHVGVADVASIVVFLLVFVEQKLHLLHRRNRKSEGKELASLLRIGAFRRGGNGVKNVRRH